MKHAIQKASCVALCLTFLVGCKKKDIPWPTHPDKPLRIESFSAEIFSNNIEMVGNVIYNERGNPIFIKKNEETTGNPDYSFVYDKNNRLTDFIGLSRNTSSFEFWHIYKYDNKDRVIVDSIFGLGDISKGRPKNATLVIARIIYDSLGRIIKYTAKHKGELLFEEIHEYNAKGNRVSSSATYDNKVNPHTLNKVWQFIDRDYSVNNPLDLVTAIEYNDKGLPVYLKTTKMFYGFLGHNIGTQLKIDYINK